MVAGFLGYGLWEMEKVIQGGSKALKGGMPEIGIASWVSPCVSVTLDLGIKSFDLINYGSLSTVTLSSHRHEINHCTGLRSKTVS